MRPSAAKRWLLRGLVSFARDRHLAGRAAEHLLAREFLNKIGIFGAVLQKFDAVFEPAALVGKNHEPLFLTRKARAYIGECDQTARTPDEVIAEVEDCRRGDGGYHKNAKKPRHAVPDSH